MEEHPIHEINKNRVFRLNHEDIRYILANEDALAMSANILKYKPDELKNILSYIEQHMGSSSRLSKKSKIDIAEKVLTPRLRQEMRSMDVDYMSLSSNPSKGAMAILDKNPKKIEFNSLLGNKSKYTIELIKKHYDNDTYLLSLCKHLSSDASKDADAFNILKRHPNKLQGCKAGLSANQDSEVLQFAHDNNLIDWYTLSANNSDAALDIIEKNPSKIDWVMLSQNSNDRAIKLLQQNPHMIYLQFLMHNTNSKAAQLLEERLIINTYLTNLLESLSSIQNNNLTILKRHLDWVNWEKLSANPHDIAIQILKENPDDIDWDALSSNTNDAAIDMLIEDLPEINFINLSMNSSEGAINLLMDIPPDEIHKDKLGLNTNFKGVIRIIKANKDSQFPNTIFDGILKNTLDPESVDVVLANIDKLSYNALRLLWKQPFIFSYDDSNDTYNFTQEEISKKDSDRQLKSITDKLTRAPSEISKSSSKTDNHLPNIFIKSAIHKPKPVSNASVTQKTYSNLSNKLSTLPDASVTQNLEKYIKMLPQNSVKNNSNPEDAASHYEDMYIDEEHRELCKIYVEISRIQKQTEIQMDSVYINPSLSITTYYNKYNKRFLLPYYIMARHNPIDPDWIRDQIQYVSSLSEQQLSMILNWSDNDYHKLKYDETFSAIFSNAPPLKKPLYVYRSERLDKKTFKEHELNTYKMVNKHTSFTLSYKVAVNWGGKYVFRAKVLPGVPLLMIESVSLVPFEFEVILPKGYIVYVQSVNNPAEIPILSLNHEKENVNYMICPDMVSNFTKRTVHFTDITVVGFYNPNIEFKSVVPTSKSILPSKVILSLQSKLEKIRLRYEAKDIYVDEDHKALCDRYRQYRDFMKTTKLESKAFEYVTVEIRDEKPTTSINHVNYYYNRYNKCFVNSLFIHTRFIPYDPTFFKRNADYIKSLSSYTFIITILEAIRQNDLNRLAPLFQNAPRTKEPMLVYGVNELKGLHKNDVFEIDTVFPLKLMMFADDLQKDMRSIRFRLLIPKNIPLISLNKHIYINAKQRFLVRDDAKKIIYYNGKHMTSSFTPEVKGNVSFDSICPNDTKSYKEITVMDLILLED